MRTWIFFYSIFILFACRPDAEWTELVHHDRREYVSIGNLGLNGLGQATFTQDDLSDNYVYDQQASDNVNVQVRYSYPYHKLEWSGKIPAGWLAYMADYLRGYRYNVYKRIEQKKYGIILEFAMMDIVSDSRVQLHYERFFVRNEGNTVSIKYSCEFKGLDPLDPDILTNIDHWRENGVQLRDEKVN